MIRPIAEQLDRGLITTARHITEQLDLGSMDVACNFCAALHWIDERVSTSPARNPRFEACCKYGDVNLPLFQPPLEYLCDLLQSRSTSARQFRERLRAYNAALAFTSVNCTVTDRGVARGGPNCF